MGDVLVLIRVLPDDVTADLDAIREAVKKLVPAEVRLRGLETKDIAFGLRALNVVVQMKDSAGGPDAFQKTLETIPHVQSVEIMDMGLPLTLICPAASTASASRTARTASSAAITAPISTAASARARKTPRSTPAKKRNEQGGPRRPTDAHVSPVHAEVLTAGEASAPHQTTGLSRTCGRPFSLSGVMEWMMVCGLTP
jgi:elongation factor 1-beta